MLDGVDGQLDCEHIKAGQEIFQRLIYLSGFLLGFSILTDGTYWMLKYFFAEE
ncbi:hypothetical protein NDK43_09670 [Neobacillus pocheonensis]|uniref:Uncharacterized protein n=1 Tax=Neobacillus pocheonensis TaxID=363869 RepID=A0ABT0W8H1_9BACI|nr:hypothetical protein [Neobacillus pocheonensis]